MLFIRWKHSYAIQCKIQIKGKVSLTLLNIELYYCSLLNIILAKTTVFTCYKDHSSAAVLPTVLYYHADTDWIFSKAILWAEHFQQLMLNHWVLTVEPTDKAFEGACFANTNQKQVFFKNGGPTINSLHKYVFMMHQRRHICKLTGLTNHRTASNQNTKYCGMHQCSWKGYRLWSLTPDDQEQLRFKNYIREINRISIQRLGVSNKTSWWQAQKILKTTVLPIQYS